MRQNQQEFIGCTCVLPAIYVARSYRDIRAAAP